MRMPTLFLSHGAPTLALEDSPTGRFLDGLAARLPRPRALVVASAHDDARRTRVSAHPNPATVHDFGGFPPLLYTLRYAAPGDPALAERIVRALGDAGIEAEADPLRGLDHGVWVPLRRLYPAADLPVVAVSINSQGDAAQHAAVGRALSFLSCEDVLVIGSGGYTHNLGALDWRNPAAPETPATSAFADWMHQRLIDADCTALLDWRQRAPQAAANHPSIEHLLPLFVAWGAGGPRPRAERLHRDVAFGALRLDAYAFHRSGSTGSVSDDPAAA